MPQITYDFNDYDESKMYQEISKVCPDIAGLMIRFRNSFLVEYAHHLWAQEVLLSNSEIAKNARAHLYNTFSEELARQLPSLEEAEQAFSEFLKYPVVQTGPHCQLLLDKCNFNTAIFSLMGIESVGNKYYFFYNCATNTLESSAKCGPGWLDLYDTHVNVFGLPRKTLSRSSVYALKAPIRFNFKPSFGKINHDRIGSFLGEVNKLIDIGEYNKPTDAFNTANIVLWKSWDKAERFYPIFIDESFFVKLLLAHLSDCHSIIYLIFKNHNLQQKILAGLKEEAQAPTGAMIPHQTDFFWIVQNNRVHPAVISDGNLYDKWNPTDKYMNLQIENLKNALENGKIIPNLFLIYLMFSILPNVRVVGGPHQIVYYLAFQRAFTSILNDHDTEQLKLKEFLGKNFHNAWGCFVLDENDEIPDLLMNHPAESLLESLIEKYSHHELVNSHRCLEAFRQKFPWGPIICNVNHKD